MSNIRRRLYKMATDFQMTSDGKYIDPDTGEILDKPPVDNENQSWEQKMQNVMYDTKKSAQTDFLDPKYYNQWNKVSPFNIIMVDDINQLYGMDPKSAADAIVNIIQGLNNTYGDDKTYDYVSQSYLNEIKMNLAKKRTMDQVIQYLTNIYFKGLGMGSSTRKVSSVDEDEIITAVAIDISNKVSLQKALVALTTFEKMIK